MNIKNIYKRHAYHIFLTLLLSLAGMSLLNSLILLGANEIHIVFLAIISITFLRIVDINKKRLILYVFILSVVATIFFISWLTKYSLLKGYQSYWKWLFKERFLEKNPSVDYQIFTISILLIIIGIPIYLFVHSYILRVVMAVVFLFGLIIVSFLQYDVPKLFVVCLLTYVLLMLTEYSYQRLYKNRGPDFIGAMTYLIPIFLLVFISLLALPTKKHPMEWRFVKYLWQSISDSTSELIANISVWMHPENADYSVLFSGYSEDGSLGGGVISSYEEVLRIKLSKKIEGGFYLQGNIKSYYANNEWGDVNGNFENTYQLKESQIDLLEIYCALAYNDLLAEETKMPSFVDYRTYIVEYDNIFTKSIFLPAKMIEVDINKNASYDKNANLKFKKLKGKETEYTVKSLELNLGSEELDKFFKQAKYNNLNKSSIDNKEGELILKLVNKFDRSSSLTVNQIESVLLKYHSYVRQNYCNVPGNMPLRVKRLSEEITKNYSTDYEKCKAIEGYLQNLNYTLTPKILKDTDDAVDSLLFETKEGYCTHFATAFAMMARTIGIPTRYLQGFYVKESSKNESNVYIVKDLDAHAWPEAYIEGIGWIAFEPTPSYQEFRYTKWKEEESANKVTPTQISYKDFLSEEEFQEIEEMGGNMSELIQKEINPFGKLIFVGILIIILICSVLYLIFKVYYNKRCYKKISGSTRILINMVQIMYILEKIGYLPLKEETIFEFFNRIDCKHINQETLPDVLNTFIKVRYHEEALDESSETLVQEFKEDLLHKTHLELGFARYKLLCLYMLIANPYRDFSR